MNKPKDRKENTIYAVVVSYNPDENLISHLDNLTKQVSKVLLFDNHSVGNGLVVVKECENIKNVQVIYSKENIGLSKAQNRAISQSLKEGAEWVLTLDDDSDMSSGFVDAMLDEYNKSDDRVGIIIPIVKDINSGVMSRYILSGNRFRKILPTKESIGVLVAISSGMLIKKDVFYEVGYMNEKYFIDYVDIEFSLRVNQRFKIITSPESVLFHRLGDKSIFKFLCFSFCLSNHSSFRRYYIYRNRIDVWKRFFKIYPKYIVYEVCVSFFEALKILFLERNRKSNAIAIFRGIIDSFKRER